MTELLRTPVRLDQLDKQHACFTGTAEETQTVQHPFGETEIATKYPMVFIQRSIWEGLGSPVAFTLVAEEGEQ